MIDFCVFRFIEDSGYAHDLICMVDFVRSGHPGLPVDTHTEAFKNGARTRRALVATAVVQSTPSLVFR